MSIKRIDIGARMSGAVIHGNTVTGCREGLFVDLKLHPGTVLTGK